MIGFVLKMAIIAFVISMFVAFVISMLYKIVTSAVVSKYYDEKVRSEYERAKRINKLRMKRIMNDIKVTENMNFGGLIDYYYGEKIHYEVDDLLTKRKKER
jgi:hypothetical protein